MDSKKFMTQQPKTNAELDAIKVSILEQCDSVDLAFQSMIYNKGNSISLSFLMDSVKDLDAQIDKLEEYFGVEKTNYKPDHYKGEQIDVIEYTRLSFTPEQFYSIMLFNIIKYSVRLGRKDEEKKEINKIRSYFIRMKEALAIFVKENE